MTKKPNYLSLTPEEEAKVQRARARAETLRKAIDREDLILAEAAVNFGWESVRDIADDVISLEDMKKLLVGAEYIYNKRVYDYAVASAAGRSTGKGAFEKLMKPYTEGVRVN